MVGVGGGCPQVTRNHDKSSSSWRPSWRAAVSAVFQFRPHAQPPRTAALQKDRSVRYFRARPITQALQCEFRAGLCE